MNRPLLWISLSLAALCACLPVASMALPDAPDTTLATPTPPTPPMLPPVASPILEKNFTGSWLWAEGDKRFRLALTQTGDKLTGFHSAEREGGGKRDSVGGSSQLPSIVGEVHGPIVVVRFKSGAPGSEAYGHARLTLRDRYLYWQLIDSTGEHYLPDNVVLIRQEDTK